MPEFTSMINMVLQYLKTSLAIVLLLIIAMTPTQSKAETRSPLVDAKVFTEELLEFASLISRLSLPERKDLYQSIYALYSTTNNEDLKFLLELRLRQLRVKQPSLND